MNQSLRPTDRQAIEDAYAAELALRAATMIEQGNVYGAAVMLSNPRTDSRFPGMNRERAEEIGGQIGREVRDIFDSNNYDDRGRFRYETGNYSSDLRYLAEDKINQSYDRDNGAAIDYARFGRQGNRWGWQRDYDPFGDRNWQYNRADECMSSSVPDRFCERELDRRQQRDDRRNPRNTAPGGGYEPGEYIPGVGVVPGRSGALKDALPSLADLGVYGGENAHELASAAGPKPDKPRELS